MKLIVGLGNPGLIYRASKHNIGFTVVKALSQSFKTPLKRDKATFSLSAKVRISGQSVLLAMPLTFMNLSGSAVSALLKKHGIDLKDLLVVLDDLDLDFGRLRLRPRGSSGGHRGLKSIIDSLDSTEFARLRIGIGRPVTGADAARYVLSPFAKKERGQLRQVIRDACDCCESWVDKGTTETMNIFNKGAETA